MNVFLSVTSSKSNVLNFNHLFWNTGNIWNEIIYEVQVWKQVVTINTVRCMLPKRYTTIRSSFSKAGSNCTIQLDACYGIRYTVWRDKITCTSKWWHIELYTTVYVVT